MITKSKPNIIILGQSTCIRNVKTLTVETQNKFWPLLIDVSPDVQDSVYNMILKDCLLLKPADTKDLAGTDVW